LLLNGRSIKYDELGIKENRKKKQGRIRDLRRFSRLAGGHKDPIEKTAPSAS